MTSIKSFLKRGKPTASDFIRFLQLLLQGMTVHGAEGAADDMGRFRDELAAVSDRLTEQASAEEILLGIGAAIHAMDEFNRRSSTFLKARTREMQGMLGMMSDTIAFLASSSTVGVERLQSIEKNLETAADIDDVRLSRLKLSECLTSLRNESFRLRDDSRKRIQILQEGLDRAASELNAASGTSAQGNAPVNGAVRRVLDPATGLQTRSAAEMAIAAKIVDGKDELVALFLVDRLPALNSRFGRKVGDEILLLVAQHLGQHLPETSPPFRWSGPAFVALANKGDAAPTTERQIKHVASMRLEKNIDTAGRTVMLPISCSVVLQKIVASDSAEAVFQALDKFVASHGGRRDV